ncbi:lysosomal thioesterase PPT2 isoform X4 [Chanodichthys erythropterus]
MMKSVCVWSLVAVCVLCVCVAYKPVIIVHGLFDSSADFINLHRFINLSHPGSNVTVLDLFDRSASLQPLWKQVQGFAEAIYPIMQNAADGVHLICYSQGGLVCRGILSTLPDHNVHSFISLSSPQAGQYGDTDYLKYLFPQFVKSNLYHVCYTAVGQKISICNYWNGAAAWTSELWVLGILKCQMLACSKQSSSSSCDRQPQAEKQEQDLLYVLHCCLLCRFLLRARMTSNTIFRLHHAYQVS